MCRTGFVSAVGGILLALAGTLPVSDDTQMTLFVLDGLLEWIEWANEGSMADPAACVWLSCLRWLRTQEGTLPAGVPEPPARWLDGRPELRVRRAPGNACLSGLAQPDMGLPEKPHNPDSKGCGTVMRSAPYGMVPGLEDELVVSLARQGAVLTHGHPAAWTSAAAFGLMVSRLMAGHGFGAAVADALDWLQTVSDDGGVADALGAAVAMAQDVRRAGTLPTVLPTELGEGWVAEEISVAGEHFVSAAVHRRLSQAFEAAGTAVNAPVVMVGLPPRTMHELAALALATCLRRRGVDVRYLGADLPVASWVSAARRLEPAAVALSLDETFELLLA